MNVYLDHAAATPLDTDVLAAMRPYFIEQFYNPSATYLAAKKVNHAIQDARNRVALWLGVRPNELVFTAGGTEANNLAIHGVMRSFPGANIVVSSIEHDSVLLPASEYDVRIAPVSSKGVVDVVALSGLIDEQTVLVSVMYANNEVGTIQPLKDVAAVIAAHMAGRSSNLPLFFHTDACQAAPYLHLRTAKLGVDLMTLNAGKMYGPKQVGVLYAKTGTQLVPQVHGGGQERGLRSGTENVPGIIGLAAALDAAQGKREVEVVRLRDLQTLFLDHIAKHIPSAIITTTYRHLLPNNVHIILPGYDNERLLMELDERGIRCAAGSACSASSEEPSHVLRAMGISAANAQSSLRFSMGRGTTMDDVEYTVKILKQILQ